MSSIASESSRRGHRGSLAMILRPCLDSSRTITFGTPTSMRTHSPTSPQSSRQCANRQFFFSATWTSRRGRDAALLTMPRSPCARSLTSSPGTSYTTARCFARDISSKRPVENTVYIALKILHVAAVVIFLGNITTGIFWKIHGDRTRDPRIVRHTLAGIIEADTWFTIPSVVVILVGGIGAA